MSNIKFNYFTRTEAEPFDFYKTPAAATHALLRREEFWGEIWECASGDGAISKLLEERYGEGMVMSSDLQVADYVHGMKGVDFLKSPYVTDNIVTNPPFSLALEFVEHALKLTRRKVAMLLPMTFLMSQKRYKLHSRAPLKAVYLFSKRIRCLRRSDPEELSRVAGMEFAWFVWDHGHKGSAAIGWIAPEEVP